MSTKVDTDLDRSAECQRSMFRRVAGHTLPLNHSVHEGYLYCKRKGVVILWCVMKMALVKELKVSILWGIILSVGSYVRVERCFGCSGIFGKMFL